jgi:hypothetical protein
MRISSFLAVVCLFLALEAGLQSQTAVEYGTITSGSTTGATTDGKDIRKSIGGVFGTLGKGLDQLSKGQQGRQRATPSRAARPAASSAARQVPPRTVNPSQIQIGMSRGELLNAVGKPDMQIGTTDEGVFAETYLYPGGKGNVTVTLRDGKVTGVSPMPEESASAPVPETPPRTSRTAEHPQ